MSCYWFNRQELLQRAKDKYGNCSGKEMSPEYSFENGKVLKEKEKNKYKS